MLFFAKEQICLCLGLQYCLCRAIIYDILYRGDGGMPTSLGIGGRRYSTDSRTGLQCCGRLSRPRRLTTSRPSLATAPAYNVVAVSRDHAGLQRRGQLARLHRLTTPRPVHLSVPPQMLRSSLPSVSRGLVYINTPGRTCLHELLLSMSKSLLGKPGFLPTNWRQIIMYY